MADLPVLPNEQAFETLLEVAPDALVLVDARGRILRANRQLEQLFGYPEGALRGEQVESLLPQRFRNRHHNHREAYQHSPRTRPMGEGLELYGLRKDGREFPVDISLAPIEMDRGLVIVAAIRDATERKRAEEVSRQLSTNRLRRRQALELNDGVVQGLTAALMALSLDDPVRAQRLIEDTLASAKTLVSQLLGELDTESGLTPGDLVRSEPAIVRRRSGA